MAFSIRHNSLYRSIELSHNEGSRGVNLSNVLLNPEIKSKMQLGMTCPIKSKHSQLPKNMEVVKLFNDIRKVVTADKLTVLNDDLLQTDLKQVGLKDIHDINCDLCPSNRWLKY